ncbi:MAG TPA: DUF3090 family protein [Chloroflexota bacterium]|nr:DUF3090 family protein [Chloroflexota bacterium]
MPSEHHDFDVVARLDTDSVGTPGNRRFRLIVQNDTQTAFLWLEKEQLQALGLAVDQLLKQERVFWSRTDPKSQPPTPQKPFDGSASVEMRVGRLGLGYDEAAKLFVMIAHDVESGPDDAPSFRCLCSRGQLSRLSETITAVTTAGRPRCPVCGSPLEGGTHFCPGSNGHGHSA